MKINADLCKDCHGLKMISFASSGFPAEFNHEFHSRMGCKECHLGIFPMKKGTTKIVMDEIYKGRLCGECHNGERAFASSECARCHDMKKFDRDVMYKVQGIGNVVFSHKFHLSIYKCQDCHTKFFAMKRTQGKMTMDAMNSGKFCGGCHNGTLATSVSQCKKCHKP
jgi:c(7)-type cytochrome triheme protein